jgi:hypothetical protein
MSNQSEQSCEVYEDLAKNFKIHNFQIFNGVVTCQIEAPITNLCTHLEKLIENSIITDYSIQEPTLYDVINNFF